MRQGYRIREGKDEEGGDRIREVIRSIENMEENAVRRHGRSKKDKVGEGGKEVKVDEESRREHGQKVPPTKCSIIKGKTVDQKL